MHANKTLPHAQRGTGLPERSRSLGRRGISRKPLVIARTCGLSIIVLPALLALIAAATSCSPASSSVEGRSTNGTGESADTESRIDEQAEDTSAGEESGSAEPRIHPGFDLSAGELESLLSEEPDAVREAVLARPGYFLELVDQTLDLPDELYVLVDKTHPLPESYRPADLVRLADYSRLRLNRDSLELSAVCLPDLLAMNEAARADGVTLVLSSAFRSYSYQKGLYEGYVEKHGREEADRFSARPGTSQHQLGTALDFGSITEKIASTPQGQWLADHAWEYGFSLSYPEGMEETTGYMWEPWHFRYMSRTATRLEREFFGGVQQHMTEFLHRRKSELRAAGL